MGRTLVPGEAAAPAVVLDEPLSFWGGVDPATGRVVDRRHPQVGADLAGRIVVMPSGRGSSSSSSVLAEMVRAGTAPAAVILREPDAIVALGAVVARELYGRAPPVVVVDPDVYFGITTGRPIRVEATDGGEPPVVAEEGR
jgi:predicted aconitase with swiveling domain